MRKTSILLAVLASGAFARLANAHELWFRLGRGADSTVVRLSFGDKPDLNEVERMAEIAHAKVWADDKLLEVKRGPGSCCCRERMDHQKRSTAQPAPGRSPATESASGP